MSASKKLPNSKKEPLSFPLMMATATIFGCMKTYCQSRLSATFNIITSPIDQEQYLTKEQLRILSNDLLMEIAALGHTHQNDDEDIVKGIQVLSHQLGTAAEPIGFASPVSDMDAACIEENAEHLRALGLLSVRTADNPQVGERQLKLQQELSRRGASGYVIRNAANLTYAFQGMCVHSAVVYHNTSVDELRELTDLAASEKACTVFMFHRVKKKGEADYESLWSYDYDHFEEFAAFLADRRRNGKIHILTNKQAFLAGITQQSWKIITTSKPVV